MIFYFDLMPRHYIRRVETFYILFDYNGRRYAGELEPIQGAGETAVYFLMIKRRYVGSLRIIRDQWVLHGNAMSDMATDLGNFLTFLKS